MPYRKILAGTDGSNGAVTGLRAAARLARALEAELLIVCGYQAPDPRTLAGWRKEAPPEMSWRLTPAAEAEEILEQARGAARGEEVEATTSAVEGHGADVTIETAEREGADLIVVGNRGMTGGKRFLLGSVPNRISHHAPCDLLIVRTTPAAAAEEPGDYESLLIATDGSATAEAAAERGFALAGRLGAAVTLFFVGESEAGAEVLRKTAERLAGDAEVRSQVVDGDPADRICEVAERGGADLIVVGSRGMTGAGRFLLGTVPNRVSHYAPCDVLIVKTT